MAVLFVMPALLVAQAAPAPQAPPPQSNVRQVSLKVGQRQTIGFPDQIRQIQIIHPRIADVVRVTKSGILLEGWAPGQTDVFVTFRHYRVTLRVAVKR